jgi:hypothetical protein
VRGARRRTLNATLTDCLDLYLVDRNRLVRYGS